MVGTARQTQLRRFGSAKSGGFSIGTAKNYKRLFASRFMVEHLLCACVPDDLLAAAGLASLRKLSTGYISVELRKRHGDTVWRLRIRRVRCRRHARWRMRK